MIERDDLARPQARKPSAEPKTPKLGKKEAAARDAKSAHEDTCWGGLLN